MADINYDPRAAHEYYLKHRKLKGNKRSTKGFDSTQKEQLDFAKEQLRQQRKQRDAASKERINANRARQAEQIKKLRQQKNEQLKKLLVKAL